MLLKYRNKPKFNEVYPRPLKNGRLLLENRLKIKGPLSTHCRQSGMDLGFPIVVISKLRLLT